MSEKEKTPREIHNENVLRAKAEFDKRMKDGV
jgi:hypothetical protein